MVWKACYTSGALLLVQVSPCAHEDRACWAIMRVTLAREEE
jgi:hypothetical protein